MAQDGRNLPLKVPRLALLFWTWCWGIVGGSVGLNSVIKRNQLVARIKNTVSSVLSTIKINIDTHDLEDSGIMLAIGCTLLAVIASLWLGLLLLDILKSRRNSNSSNTKVPLSTRTLPLQWMSLAFMSVWLIACLIPVTYYAAHSGAKTTAFNGDQPLPDSFVQTASASLGVKPDYWSMNFVRIQIIPPWFTWASCVITTVVLFLASNRRSGSDSTHAISGAGDRTSKDTGMEEKHAGDFSPISPVDKAHHEHVHGTQPVPAG